MFCPRCGAPIKGKAKYCKTCGIVLQQHAYSNNHNPRKRRFLPIKIGLIVFAGLVVAGAISAVIGSTQKTSVPDIVDEHDEQIETPNDIGQEISASESNDRRDFDEYVYSALLYHPDVINETINLAEAAGMRAAFKINLRLYRMSSQFEYKVYFYAINGKADFLDKFGDEDLLEVQGYIEQIYQENNDQTTLEELEDYIAKARTFVDDGSILDN